MNILVVDSQGVLSEKQTSYARNRLYYALLRFEHRVNGATIHFALDEEREQVSCAVNVSVEGAGIITAKKSGLSSSEVLNLAVSVIEPKVARRVDWRAWFNADSIATWMLLASQPVRLLFGWRHRDAIKLKPSAAIQPLPDTTIPQHQKRLNGPHFDVRARNINTFSN